MDDFRSNPSLAIMPWLAQALPPDGPVAKKIETSPQQADIFFWLMMIVLLAIVIGTIGYTIYRKLKKEVDEPNPSLDAAFSLSEMRRLYEAGEISHDEYMNIRGKLLGPAKAAMLGEASEPAVAEETSAASEAPSQDKPAEKPQADTQATSTPSPADEGKEELFDWEKKKDGDSGPPRDDTSGASDDGPDDPPPNSGDGDELRQD